MNTMLNPDAATFASSNLRILIIDDNTAIHEDVRKILGVAAREDCDLDEDAAMLFGGEVATAHTGTEFEIDSAFQGQDGLTMVQAALDAGRPYAMAFVDVRMPPGWDGIETIKRIWQKYPQLQVVICTAYSDYSWDQMIRELGQTDSLVILKKPFDNVEVLQLAHTLTQKWMLSHRLQTHLVTLDAEVARRTEELQAANSRLRQEMDERTQAQRQLGESEERFSRAFQASPIPMAIHSLANERFVDVNDAFVAISGRRRLEVLGRTPRELGLYVDEEAHTAFFAQLLCDRSVRNFECKILSRPAGVRQCVVSAEAFPLGDELVALVATVDVTEQRNLEQQLRHSQKLEAVGQFAAGVAHDFNNILTVIQGHASLQLATEDLDADMTKSLEQMSNAAERAAGLTKQLLMFSRKQVVQPRAVNLNNVVRNLHDMLSRLIGEHIDLECEFADKLPAIHADTGNIEQIVMNLVINARDAMPRGGRITVRTGCVQFGLELLERRPQSKPGRYVCLTVADTGIGMSPQTISRIFEPFFTTKEVGQGSGLGLATVYGIVAQHGGWIEVVSAPGEGSHFQLFIPGEEGEAETSTQFSSVELRGGTETILVVEDEAAVREVITSVLRHRGYRVLEAGDGPEALGVWSCKADEIDLLLTDIVMPNGLRGNLLADRLKSEKSELKVIYSSGYSPEFGTESAPLTERIRFLEKPYKPEVLVKAVRDCLDGVGQS